MLAFGRQNNQPLGPVLEAIVRPSKPQKLLPARGQVRRVGRKPRRTLVGRGKLYQPHFSLISLLWLMTQQTWGPHPRSRWVPQPNIKTWGCAGNWIANMAIFCCCDCLKLYLEKVAQSGREKRTIVTRKAFSQIHKLIL